MYTLYSIPGSCSTGIHILLNKLGQDVEIVKREDVDDYKTLVPTNQVPALKDQDALLTEGASIVLYLLDKHDKNIEDVSNTTEFKQWLMFNYATMHSSYSQLFSANGKMPESEEKNVFMQSLADQTTELWAIVDQRLSNHAFMLGDTPTIVDYLLAVYLRWGNVFPQLQIPVGNNVVRMVNHVVELPEVQAAFKKENVEYAIPANAVSH